MANLRAERSRGARREQRSRALWQHPERRGRGVARAGQRARAGKRPRRPGLKASHGAFRESDGDRVLLLLYYYQA